MRITNDQIRYIHVLLPADIKQDKEQKRSLMAQFTGDRDKYSTLDLTFAQANELILSLGGKPQGYDNWALFDKEKDSHLKILSLCMELGWSVWNEQLKRQVADLYRLSEWLQSDKSPVRKRLKKMSPKEVSTIIYAMEQMIQKRYTNERSKL